MGETVGPPVLTLMKTLALTRTYELWEGHGARH